MQYLGMACVYCGNLTNGPCCGEMHHEKAYETHNDEIIFEHEIPIYECGKAANDTINGLGQYVCGCNIRHKELKPIPSIVGRIAKCSCGREKPSNKLLPFYKYCANNKTDEFYCGHNGWD